ncbi:DUF1330 domain-containing protein [Sphingobium fluviale]|nr:DUF1330 domain-containing protein [Sphingobium fluviale]
MPTTMVVHMRIHDSGWLREYSEAVPPLLAEYGAYSFSAGKQVHRLEGTAPPPDRIAVIEFPSREAVEAFMADERYQKYKHMREAGSSSQIFIYPNAVPARGFA